MISKRFPTSIQPAVLPILLAVPLFCGLAHGQTGFFAPQTPAGAAEPFTVRAEVAPSEIPAGASGEIRVNLDIADGFRIYADEVRVTPAPTPGIRFGDPKSPPGVEKPEPDGNRARFFVEDTVVALPFRVDAERESGPLAIPLAANYRGCSETNCFFPVETTLTAQLTVQPPAAVGADGETALAVPESPPAPAEPSGSAPPAEDENPFQRTVRRFGVTGAMAAAFFWGFLASLTPCVYPMIPITAGVIGAANTGSLARGFTLSLFYVLGMSLTYAAFGVAAAWSGGLFGAYAGHPAVRIAVALIFVALALSLFDLFYFQVPVGLSSRMAGLRKGGGVLGVLATGAVAGAVVGPCVGPMLAGLLVYIAGLGDRLQGFLLMWSFALGMGVLFLAIGTFSGAASALPRSGAWMGKLKAVFGVLMLGAALYYISPLLPPQITLLILGGLLIGAGVFAGALDRTDPETSKGERLWKAAGIVVLVLGVVYAARFALNDPVGSSGSSTPVAAAPETAEIAWMEDHAAGLALAGRTGRPVLLDFTADWCAVCKELEARTFPHPEVVRKSREFVPIRVDATDAAAPRVRALQRQYDVVGLPTVLFLSPDGEPIPGKRLTEFVPPEALLAQMERVRQHIVSLTGPASPASDPSKESPS
ncbi:MAG: protein-disulfide reductase DsbD [Desulfococcaceae bacterium]